MIECAIHISDLPKVPLVGGQFDRALRRLLREHGFEPDRAYATFVVGMDGDETYRFRQLTAEEANDLPTTKQVLALACSLGALPAPAKRRVRKLARSSNRDELLTPLLFNDSLSDAGKMEILLAFLYREMMVKGIAS